MVVERIASIRLRKRRGSENQGARGWWRRCGLLCRTSCHFRCGSDVWTM